MSPKAPEKLHTQQQQQQQQQQEKPQIPISPVKHSNPFYISPRNLCHNRRLKLKRSKYGEYLRKFFLNRPSTQKLLKKTEAARKQKLNSLLPDVTIDLLSDDEESAKMYNQYATAYPERMCLERAAILGLMPVERVKAPSPPLLVPMYNNIQVQQIPIQEMQPQYAQQQEQYQQQLQQLQNQQQLQHQHTTQAQPRKRKSRPQKRNSLPAVTIRPEPPILLNNESIVLSDDEPEISITCPTSHQIPCLPPQTTMQVDEEVTISLVPRSLTATTCASRSATSSTSITAINSKTQPHSNAFPMLPDETTVHTVIANRIYELSLTKLREGLASCGIPEFADGHQKISPPRRKGAVQKPPVVSPPQAPISLKLSSDLSISLISDDEDDLRHRYKNRDAILSPAFLQKLPVNVSIAPVPMMRPQTQHNHTTELRKLKLG